MKHELRTLTLLLSLGACSSGSEVAAAVETNPVARGCHAPRIREGFEIFAASDKKTRGARPMKVDGKTFYLTGEAVIDSSDIASVTELWSQADSSGTRVPVYDIRLNDEGARALAKGTRQAQGRHLVVVRDGVGLSAPFVASPITTGQFHYAPPQSATTAPLSELTSFCGE